MSLTKDWLIEQQQHEAEALKRAAEKQAEIAADIEEMIRNGGANLPDIELLARKQAELGKEIEILRTYLD